MKAKALKECEAELLGIPFPLQRGWTRKYGAMEIEDGMVSQLMAYADVARQGVKEKVRAKKAESRAVRSASIQLQLSNARAWLPVSPVPGFVSRLARRYRKSKSIPWVIKVPNRVDRVSVRYFKYNKN
jgi:hypothetical protein